jgi:hypothetical protein
MNIIAYGIYAYMAKMNNHAGGNWLWIMLVWAATACAIPWVLCSRVSTNIMLDGTVGSVTILLIYLVVMWYLGEGSAFTAIQWAGLGVISAGYLMVRLG